MPGPYLKIASSPEAAASQCASDILDALGEALQARALASIAISGGTTPKLLFADLARASFDWSRVHVFWVDERCVPPADAQSNFKLANDAWLAAANYPNENVHRVWGELDPTEAAKRYSEEIKNFFGLKNGGLPTFDVLHRGMGPDAHTASLFPGEPLIENRSDVAAHVWVEKLKMHRVTLLPGVLLSARKTVLQVSGADKADAVKNVILGPEDWLKYPCQIASRDSKATWFLDQASAAKL